MPSCFSYRKLTTVKILTSDYHRGNIKNTNICSIKNRKGRGGRQPPTSDVLLHTNEEKE